MANDSAIPDELIQSLRLAQSVAILTGAGISAESGIPTFRDAMTGLWSAYRPEDLATPAAFQRNPRLVWEWYAWRRSLAANAQPNPAHYALASLEQHVPAFTLVTQNVDNLHQRAGSQNVIELHGNIQRVKCSAEHVVIDTWETQEGTPPICPRCGSLLRPDVVWFGEVLPAAAFEQAVAAAAQCDVFLAIGTSGVVEPAASLPRVAAQHGATLVILNLDVTPYHHRNVFHLHGRAGILLPELARRAWPNQELMSR